MLFLLARSLLVHFAYNPSIQQMAHTQHAPLMSVLTVWGDENRKHVVCSTVFSLNQVFISICVTGCAKLSRLKRASLSKRAVSQKGRESERVIIVIIIFSFLLSLGTSSTHRYCSGKDKILLVTWVVLWLGIVDSFSEWKRGRALLLSQPYSYGIILPVLFKIAGETQYATDTNTHCENDSIRERIWFSHCQLAEQGKQVLSTLLLW